MIERFEHRPMEFVSVAGPTLVYIGVRDRREFDAIRIPVEDNGENERGHVLTKRIGNFRGSEVTVIFQYWIKSLTSEAFRTYYEAAKAESRASLQESGPTEQERGHLG